MDYNHKKIIDGIPMSDQRYCELTGVDPKLAGTPEINREYIKNNEKGLELLNKRLADHGLDRMEM